MEQHGLIGPAPFSDPLLVSLLYRLTLSFVKTPVQWTQVLTLVTKPCPPGDELYLTVGPPDRGSGNCRRRREAQGCPAYRVIRADGFTAGLLKGVGG
jgi:hypothetical protein